jgi:hypothetical protein
VFGTAVVSGAAVGSGAAVISGAAPSEVVGSDPSPVVAVVVLEQAAAPRPIAKTITAVSVLIVTLLITQSSLSTMLIGD